MRGSIFASGRKLKVMRSFFALDLRHVQTVGRHTDEGDPQQIVHCLGDVAEAV